MAVFKRFGTDQRGATATIFGLTLLPLLGVAGAAVDYSRAASLHSRMQLAADATALAIVREPTTATEKQIQAKGELYVADTLRSDPNATLGSVTAKRVGRTVTVAATASMNTTIMRVLGVPAMPVSVTATASSARRLEVALVLDNTYSMTETVSGTVKMEALKKEVLKTLESLRSLAAGREAGSIKVSIVPFDTEVRLDAGKYRNETWFRWEDRTMRPSDWSGYVYDRHNAYAQSDLPPSVDQDSLFPGLRASECARNGKMGCPSNADLPAMQPLVSITESYGALTGLVTSMQPRGFTNVALGTVWGQATLSRSKPFTEGAEATDESVQKVMLVLTDGVNTAHHRNGVIENSVWLKDAGRLTEAKAVVSRIDGNTRAACQSAKAANIEIFTIRLLEGDEDLLRSCASSSDNYANVQSGSDLSAAFQKFLDKITRTRVVS